MATMATMAGVVERRRQQRAVGADGRFATRIRRWQRGLLAALNRLAPPCPDDRGELPAEWFKYPPF